MAPRRRVENLMSAGGVVHRCGAVGLEVAICGLDSPESWRLPKGTPEPGESREEAARRETEEETGLLVEIDRYIDSIDYWFVRHYDGVRCHKTYTIYLMSPTGADVSLHDHEFDVVKWAPVEEALETLSYDSEVQIVQASVAMVTGRAAGERAGSSAHHGRQGRSS